MSANVDNVHLGRCDIEYNNIDLGATLGGCEFHYIPEYHLTKVDNYTGYAKSTLVSERATAVVRLAESSIANLKVAMPAGTTSGAATPTSIYVGDGTPHTGYELKLSPVDTSYVITVYKAIVVSEVTLPFVVDGERMVEVTFEALVDTTKDAGKRLYDISE